MHGTAMLIIRGGFDGALRSQTMHACVDTFDSDCRHRGTIEASGQLRPQVAANLILGEAEQSRVGNGKGGNGKEIKTRKPKR